MADNTVDSEIIQGFSLDITSLELAEYAAKRAQHHGKRADLYEAEVKKISDIKKDDDMETKMVSKFSHGNDPVAELQKSAQSHRKRERFFSFASEHFAKGRVYRLRHDDLTILEIIPSRGY